MFQYLYKAKKEKSVLEANCCPTGPKDLPLIVATEATSLTVNKRNQGKFLVLVDKWHSTTVRIAIVYGFGSLLWLCLVSENKCTLIGC